MGAGDRPACRGVAWGKGAGAGDRPACRGVAWGKGAWPQGAGAGDRPACRGVAWGLILVLLWVTGVAGSAAASDRSGGSASVVQADRFDFRPTRLSEESATMTVAQADSDSPSTPSPQKSDDEVRLVLALLIAVAVVALLGTLIYWVRTGDGSPRGGGDVTDVPESGDTLE